MSQTFSSGSTLFSLFRQTSEVTLAKTKLGGDDFCVRIVTQVYFTLLRHIGYGIVFAGSCLTLIH